MILEHIWMSHMEISHVFSNAMVVIVLYVDYVALLTILGLGLQRLQYRGIYFVVTKNHDLSFDKLTSRLQKVQALRCHEY